MRSYRNKGAGAPTCKRLYPWVMENSVKAALYSFGAFSADWKPALDRNANQ